MPRPAVGITFAAMIVLLSPAKRLVDQGPLRTQTHTLPAHLDRSSLLVGKLQKMSGKRLAELMDISADLAHLNQQRFQTWDADFKPENARPALLSFMGDVYQGLDASTLSSAELNLAQHHLRILSGLHGLLRPLDLMKPYRLEMGTQLPVKRHKNLYGFWGNTPTEDINAALLELPKEEPLVLNLASNEYFKAVKPALLEAPLLHVDFREFKNGVYKPIQLFLKQARGYMARWIIQNRIDSADQLPGFDREGYRFDAQSSTSEKLVFLRG